MLAGQNLSPLAVLSISMQLRRKACKVREFIEEVEGNVIMEIRDLMKNGQAPEVQ
jgi:hypothetical protein